MKWNKIFIICVICGICSVWAESSLESSEVVVDSVDSTKATDSIVADSSTDSAAVDSTKAADSANGEKNLLDNYMLSIGANLITGTTMGVNFEFGFPFVKRSEFEWRNFVSVGGGAMKLNPKGKMDTTFWLVSEKMTLSWLGGSSLMSHAGFMWFRPYLFVAGGFGSIVRGVDYFEFSGGLGHEFITQNNHTIFFELGGEYSMTTQKITAENLGGAVKFWLGYRWYF